eukprot:TRINITY_DN1358_c0_g1_i2.p1 TRINITY_DN1358_c0_g1~~TRINITY_DN1358_c0_g1_i2.p1  ORF type:complete len:332 (-),score=17.92 TRINITY_DN1358_c0_g1_i2:273-1226(-)
MKCQFSGPEFKHVLKQIYKKENKKGYHQLRILNKEHKSAFEDSFEQACVAYRNLQKFVKSKFANLVQYLQVQIRCDSDDWNLLRFISATYLPKIQKVKVNVIRYNEYPPDKIFKQQIDASEPLIFHGVDFVGFHNLSLSINSSNDIEILNSKFKTLTLQLKGFNKVFIKNSTFNTSGLFDVLQITDSRSQVTIEIVQVLHIKGAGLQMRRCENAIINNLQMINCGCGCIFKFVNIVILGNTKAVDCYTGFVFEDCQNAIMEDCVAEDFEYKGLHILRSNLNYKGLYFNNNQITENNLQEFLSNRQIQLRESIFARIL